MASTILSNSAFTGSFPCAFPEVGDSFPRLQRPVHAATESTPNRRVDCRDRRPKNTTRGMRIPLASLPVEIVQAGEIALSPNPLHSILHNRLVFLEPITHRFLRDFQVNQRRAAAPNAVFRRRHS